MKLFILFVTLIFSGILTNAQHNQVEIFMDARLDSMVNKKLNDNVKCFPIITGYRILLTTSSSLKEIKEVRKAFNSKYPELDSHIIFGSDMYVLKIGRFEMIEEATSVKLILESEFPDALVIKDMIPLFETN